MADFSTLDTAAASDAGATFIPKHPATGEQLDASFDVVGADSGRIRRVLNKGKLDAVVHLMKVKKARGEAEPTAEEMAETMADGEVRKFGLELDVVCEAVTGWANVEIGGVAIEFEERREFFKKYPWLVSQIIEFVDDLGNFMKPAKAS